MAENILHYAAVRMRVTGAGSLKMKMLSLDDVVTSDLIPFTMAATTAKEPTRLCNFISQRARLRVYTTVINERFVINRIIIYAKQIWASYPGTE